MAGRPYVVLEDDDMKIVRRTSNGRRDPAHFEIQLPRDAESQSHWPRNLKITIDELMALADALADLCDDIEDGKIFGDKS